MRCSTPYCIGKQFLHCVLCFQAVRNSLFSDYPFPALACKRLQPQFNGRLLTYASGWKEQTEIGVSLSLQFLKLTTQINCIANLFFNCLYNYSFRQLKNILQNSTIQYLRFRLKFLTKPNLKSLRFLFKKKSTKHHSDGNIISLLKINIYNIYF